MNDLNIFENAKPLTGKFFTFKNIGDRIQGTYIGNREAVDTYGNPQTVYVLMDKDGAIWNVGFRKTALVIHERMKSIRTGQIVGFSFDEERENKKNPSLHKTKIVRIYADPKLVDHEWLKQQRELYSQYGDSAPQGRPDYPSTEESLLPDRESLNAFPESSAPEDLKPPASNLPKDTAVKARNEAIEAIRNLSNTKGLTSSAMTEEAADKAIEGYVGLPLKEENLTKIIIALTGYTKK